ncbi:hypothetical protein QE368_002846 [Asaia bogorensis NBRC 16594]|nr:MFS transporter [Asaia bogorensis]MDR6184004.1 hypothetical protein [Asaia bogorensis NBRC 16594]
MASPDGISLSVTPTSGRQTDSIQPPVVMPSWLPLLLGFLTAVGPVSTDIYLPAFPALEKSLHSPAGSAGMTLSAWMVGLAIGQISMGPLADRFGRRIPMLLGMIVYTAGQCRLRHGDHHERHVLLPAHCGHRCVGQYRDSECLRA